ncbi:MAG: phage tail protein [Clostridiaceae bacterium]|nr:phage tail protein [Clostridiaceae bacterium]MBW4860331.1 phage tail protein [Clostridiaceae bacterium]MBW4867222.1 phage tail protein [Clostridiaceae bacterium]
MSYPILYKANETDFSHLGLGVLTDTVSALVTEKRNGIFELEMKYPIDGVLFKEIKNDRLIKADASNNLKNQRFKIIRISKPAKGLITIYAEHVSYLTQDLPLEPEVQYSGDALTALNIWKNNIVDDHPFNVYSNISTIGSGKWVINEVENARRALGGVQGSILDSYGGEYRFDNYHIGLYAQRGNDSGALIAYGKNLIDLEQEEEIANTYTSIYPFVTIRENDDEKILTLPERFIDSEYVDNYARRKILTVDFSNEEIETVAQLRVRAQRYITDNDVGVPKVNLRVKFIDLAKTLDYKNLKLVEEINLCDLVTVYFEKLDIMQKAKVIKTVWDVLLDRYDSIEIGETRSSLSDSVNTIVDGKVERVEEKINLIQIAANGKNRVFRGAEEPASGMSENDLWYKPVGDGETELYRFDGTIWRLEKVSAGLLGGTLDAENGDVNLINVNVNNLVGNISEFVKSYWNAINSRAEINGEHLKFTHDNGSYTELSSKGLMRYDSGTGKQYHYMTKIIKFIAGADGQAPSNKWIPLGPEFNDKNWSVALSISDSMGASSNEATIHRIVLTQGHDSNNRPVQPRFRNGQWEYPVMGYKTNYNCKNDSRRYGPVAGIMIITA